MSPLLPRDASEKFKRRILSILEKDLVSVAFFDAGEESKRIELNPADGLEIISAFAAEGSSDKARTLCHRWMLTEYLKQHDLNLYKVLFPRKEC